MRAKNKTIWERANRIARKVADFQAKVILTILYVVMALPTGLVVRISEDVLSLRRQPGKASHWRQRRTLKHTVHEARRQG